MAKPEAALRQAKPACTAGAAAGDVVHASVNAVSRALPSLCLADVVLCAATGAVAKLVVGGGKAWRRADALGFNHSPPPRPRYTSRHAAARPGPAHVSTAPVVAADKASERTKALAGGRAGFPRSLAVWKRRRFPDKSALNDDLNGEARQRQANMLAVFCSLQK